MKKNLKIGDLVQVVVVERTWADEGSNGWYWYDADEQGATTYLNGPFNSEVEAEADSRRELLSGCIISQVRLTAQ
jgi:hypothetical protein